MISFPKFDRNCSSRSRRSSSRCRSRTFNAMLASSSRWARSRDSVTSRATPKRARTPSLLSFNGTRVTLCQAGFPPFPSRYWPSTKRGSPVVKTMLLTSFCLASISGGHPGWNGVDR